MKKFARIDERYYEIVEETDEEVCLLIPFDYENEGSKILPCWCQKTEVD